jgi:DTW domain-containing protein YfiP
MNLSTFRKLRADRAILQQSAINKLRTICVRCRKSVKTCVCSQAEPVRLAFELAILIHPRESRKRIGTGRLLYLSVAGSHLIEGVDFSKNRELAQLLQDSTLHPVLLYPGTRSRTLTEESVVALCPADKTLLVILLDGTWSHAKKMLRLNSNLALLPQIQLEPSRPSQYKIRRQPRPGCLSSIEAAYSLAQALACSSRWPLPPNFSRMLRIFDSMVSTQLQYVTASGGRATRGSRGSR